MSSGWCPRLHRFTASTHRVDDDDEAEASELAGSRGVARDWGLGYMKGDRRKPSNGRSRIIDNKPICSMADGSGCGDDQEEPVCSPHKSKMARFFLLPRSKLNRSVAAGGSSFHFPKWTQNKKKEKRHGNGRARSRGVGKAWLAPRCPCPPISLLVCLSVPSWLHSAKREGGAQSSPRSFRPSRRPVFVEAVSSTRCSLQAGTDTWDGEAPLDGRATVPTQSLRVPGAPSHCRKGGTPVAPSLLGQRCDATRARNGAGDCEKSMAPPCTVPGDPGRRCAPGPNRGGVRKKSYPLGFHLAFPQDSPSNVPSLDYKEAITPSPI